LTHSGDRCDKRIVSLQATRPEEPIQGKVFLEESKSGSVWLKRINGTRLGPFVKIERVETIGSTNVRSEVNVCGQALHPPLDLALVHSDQNLRLML
jgi:hypothetical protein